jgi:formylglycine-generating enzyme required for sulfatase activity
VVAASREAQSALLLDGAFAPARRLMGESLVLRVDLARRTFQAEEARALEADLANFDPDGTIRERLRIPAFDTKPDTNPPRSVPADFVYVPPGCFQFGSADPEWIRTIFFHTTPLHRVCTGGYVIGRHEVTFADWISFLDALAEPERTRRLPRVNRDGAELGLRQLDGRWRLVLQPTDAPDTRVEASWGSPFVYPHRARRARQDWRRFPVSGIDVDDAHAYLDWLSRSGTLPGARLCTEHEWERAARGDDARRYPGGDRLEPDDANIDVTYGPRDCGPDEVESHPSSRSPLGLYDMAGNVSEMVSSVRARAETIYRGGGWYFDSTIAISSNREHGDPALRSLTLGLRVCASVADLEAHWGSVAAPEGR